MRVVVVGAGLAGLAAGGRLREAGHDVVLFDKGRSPGGRLATRRIGQATLDHGAQFFTVRSDTFGAIVEPHRSSGLVYEWCRGFVDGGDGYPRYASRGGLNSFAKALAAGLDVRTKSMVFAIRTAPAGSAHRWSVALDDGSSVDADALVVTCPVPQSYSLLVSASVELPPDLIRIDYDRTVALLITLDGPSGVAEPGGLQNPTDMLSFVSDNRRKGISVGDALTIHANAAWSLEHWNEDHAALESALRSEAAAFIGAATVTDAQIKKWRFATPRTAWADPCWIAPADAGPLVLAGDAFAGPKIEGAVLSGLASAEALLSG
jgi:renalase